MCVSKPFEKMRSAINHQLKYHNHDGPTKRMFASVVQLLKNDCNQNESQICQHCISKFQSAFSFHRLGINAALLPLAQLQSNKSIFYITFCSDAWHTSPFLRRRIVEDN